jgi:guanylate kinase
MKNTILIIAGPSCSGKSYLAQKLISEGGYQEAVSTTTRSPRVGEENGIHYNFKTRSEFEEMMKKNMFVETAEIRGNLYGVSRAEYETLFSSNKTPVIVCDPEGVVSNFNYCLEQNWSPVSLFIDVDLSSAISRFYERYILEIKGNKESADDMAKNMTLAILNETSWKKYTKYDSFEKASSNEADAERIKSNIISHIELIKAGKFSDVQSKSPKTHGIKKQYSMETQLLIQDNIKNYLISNVSNSIKIASFDIINIAKNGLDTAMCQEEEYESNKSF